MVGRQSAGLDLIGDKWFGWQRRITLRTLVRETASIEGGPPRIWNVNGIISVDSMIPDSMRKPAAWKPKV
jgi:hypothetical protein